MSRAAVLTVGHGTLAQDEFATLVRGAGVDHVVDVRSYPGSRRHPQFRREAMEEWLPERGVAYSWEPRLGGRRKGAKTSPHVGLRHEAFRAYADHMESAEFGDALDRLVEQAGDERAAVMCAESVWWRCHRRLLSDGLVLLRDVAVEHLFHDGRLQEHPPTPEARVDDGRVVYDVGEDRPLL